VKRITALWRIDQGRDGKTVYDPVILRALTVSRGAARSFAQSIAYNDANDKIFPPMPMPAERLVARAGGI
jgi:hypothetical protein